MLFIEDILFELENSEFLDRKTFSFFFSFFPVIFATYAVDCNLPSYDSIFTTFEISMFKKAIKRV